MCNEFFEGGISMSSSNKESTAALDMIAFIACDGAAAGKDRFKGYESCKEAVDSGFVRGECKSGCVGVGSCITSCTKDAMRLENGKAVIDLSLCDGCGDCAKPDVCPQKLIRMIPREATNFIPCSSTEEDEDKVREICGYGCLACGDCVRACPEGAVDIINNHAVIDYDKCVGCVACAVKCKKKIIIDTLHDITKLKEKVAFVKCSGGYKPNLVYRDMGFEDCRAVVGNANPIELGLCSTSCTGLGDCTRVCRYDAIHIINGTARVDPDQCVGCKDCYYACPKGLIQMVPYKGMKQVPCSSIADYEEKEKVCPSGCIACEDCVNNCPNEAIFMEDQHAVIDVDLCEDCGMCQYMCPRYLILRQEVPESVFLQRAALGLQEGV